MFGSRYFGSAFFGRHFFGPGQASQPQPTTQEEGGGGAAWLRQQRAWWLQQYYTAQPAQQDAVAPGAFLTFYVEIIPGLASGSSTTSKSELSSRISFVVEGSASPEWETPRVIVLASFDLRIGEVSADGYVGTVAAPQLRMSTLSGNASVSVRVGGAVVEMLLDIAA